MARVTELMDRACATTGLAEFGDDSFREGLEILVEAADREARFTEMGAAAFDAQIVDLLSCRLQVEHWYARHPEIDEQQIVAPLIGLGLPRTGSTALSCLLAEDPAARSIRNWEAQAPCPPPELEKQDSDPRIARAEAAMERRDRLFPRMKAMVPSSATSPSECQTFMGYDFKSQLFQAFANVPSYTEWLNHRADLVPTYRYVKRVLKLLQWRCPPTRWRLKNPSHSLFIGALDSVFPDARFWMTHRNVAQVIPSVADLYFELGSAYSDAADKPALGDLTTDFCELGMSRMIAFRDAGNDHRFFDVHFAPFQADPFMVIEQLYDWLGEELTDTTRARMQAWRAANAREKHGSHKVDPTDFGIDVATLAARFAFYTGRFGVAG
ncbi:sulfotransferase [Sphingomonas sp. SUN039]|uniref:sulfotransferase family protein n=1 Tax=Sphingomonas sp. SUN039 TaxID=2937787 RepID=UPI002164E0BF|nr:sulfotransferase [Sphingomonas sp. SUN039]UVO54250.1 sulfotransferase [Sphingomonas sp. SUN039]